MKATRIFAVVATVVFFSLTKLNAYNGAANPIYVTIDGERSVYSTEAETIAEFFEEAGIEVDETDMLNVELTDLVISARGVVNPTPREVIIARGFEITINYESFTEATKVKQGTTGIRLAEKISREKGKTYAFEGNGFGVLEEGKEYNLLLNVGGKLIKPQIDRRVYDSEEYVIEYLVLPFDVEVRPTFDLSVGEENVIRDGVEGRKEVLYKVASLNGVEQFKNAVQEITITEPVTKIVERGIAGALEEDLSELKIVEKFEMSATAYTLDYKSTGKKPGDKGFGITSSGLMVRQGIVAVDPKVIPLGTKLYIEGYGYAIAADTGGSVKGNKIDLYFEDVAKAYGFGRKTLIVYVLAD